MIVKRGKCPLCPPDAPEKFLKKGVCESHYWSNLKASSAIKRATAKSPIIQERNEWYQWQHCTKQYKCENCGDNNLPLFNWKVTKSHHAHILPKALFPSVADHKDNHLLLCGFYTKSGCHSAFDSNWERASQMPVFPLAQERFLLFANVLTATEINQLPIQFTELLHNHPEVRGSFFS